MSSIGKAGEEKGGVDLDVLEAFAKSRLKTSALAPHLLALIGEVRVGRRVIEVGVCPTCHSQKATAMVKMAYSADRECWDPTGYHAARSALKAS